MAASNLSIIIFSATGVLLAVLAIYTCLFYPITGYYMILTIAFFAFYPNRLLNRELPISTFIEVLVLFLFIGVYWNRTKDFNQRGNLLNYAPTILLLFNVLYFIMELFNPNMGNPTGWFFASKRYLVYILFYVITYRMINTPERLKTFLKYWILMSFVAGFYGCLQQWVGFPPWELEFIKNDPHEYALLFQGGVIRKFSFLDGVVTFGNLCGSMAVLTIILLLNEKDKLIRRWLYLISLILFLGMSYSGTRTTTIMIPAGITLFVLMSKKNKATLIAFFSAFMFLMTVLFIPIDNPTINRMRSTFDTKDESLNVRHLNRKLIQPYIYTNPMGGGVGSSGVEGMRFNPTHRLAGFPPDSGLLKLAIDMGWIGLTITMIFYLIILYEGILLYSRLRYDRYKTIVCAITCALFSIFVTLYAQVSIGQIPNAFFFYGVIPLFKRISEFDKLGKIIMNSTMSKL